VTPPIPDWQRASMVAGAVFLLFVLVFVLGRCSAPGRVDDVPLLDIDAGPGEAIIAAELDGAVVLEDERLAELEAAHAAELEAFNDVERQKYDEARARGRGALAGWLKDRSRLLLADGGSR